MGTDKRERQKELRRAKLEAEVAAARRRQSTRRIITVVVVAVVGAGLLWLLTGGEGDDASLSDVTTTTSDFPGTTLPVPDTVPVKALTSADGGFVYGEGECAPEGGADGRKTAFEASPKQCIDPAAHDYRATVSTSLGDFVIDLYDDRAPGTVNNFVNLARFSYYDSVIFHRVIDDFVIQAGDPTATGRAGPGYQIADELPDSVEAYKIGTVAMANAGPNTNGAQWFVYHGPNPLPGPQYSIFGKVTVETLPTTAEILTVDTDPQRERPLEDVVIESITIDVLDDGAIDDFAD